MPFCNVTVADFGVVFIDVNDDDNDIIWHLFDVLFIQGRDCTYFRECNPSVNQVI